MELAVSSDNQTLMIATLAFGFLALMGAAAVRMIDKKEFGVYFVKLFGLLFIGTLAVAIVFADLEEGTRTGAYTILGTIAGYLAGSKVPPKGGDGGSGDEGEDDEEPTPVAPTEVR